MDVGGAEIGQHHEMFNERVIALKQSIRLRRNAPGVKPLPPQAFGAIMTVQWRMSLIGEPEIRVAPMRASQGGAA